MNSAAWPILFPDGEYLSIPNGAFPSSPTGNETQRMLTIAETRRARLEMLIAQYGGKIANLNEALGFARNDTRLARIRNANVRHERGGKAYVMGEEQARAIEDALQLERGWMDTPPGYADLDDPRISHVVKVMEAMPAWQRDQAVKIVDTLAEPPARNGTEN